MNIVIIGSGNVAAVLGRMFRAAGHDILQVVSRNAQAASELAYEWDSESANYMTLLNPTAELYVLAVPDDAIATLVADLRLPDALVVHTAASVSKDILKGVSPSYGVLYPLQSLRKERNLIPEIPLYIDAGSDSSFKKLRELAGSISGFPAVDASDTERVKLHLAAVFVSNFPNHLYALAEDYCRTEGIAFEQLYPLIIETATRLDSASAASLQTGPAARGDRSTMDAHLLLLKDHPQLRAIYEVMSDSIRQFN